MIRLNKNLDKGALLPLLIKFSIPSTIAVLINIIYNITDRYFIGQAIGRYGMSALSIVFPLILLINGTGLMFSVGGGALAGIKLGERREGEAEKVLGTTVFWVGIVGVIYTLLILGLLKPILGIMGGTEGNISYALEYSRWLFPAITAQMLYVVLCAFLRTEGRPSYSMWMNLGSALLNMILDYIFIVKFSMGMKGAAMATAIATTLPAIYLLIYFSGSRLLRLRRINLSPNIPIIKRILSIGSSAFFNQVLNGVMVFIMNRQLLVYGGDLALAAIGIITTVRSFINTSFIGFNHGRQPILSFNYGAANFKRVRETFILSSKIILTISLTLVTLVIIGAEGISAFFLNNDEKLIEFTSWAIRRHLFLMAATALYLTCANYFQAVGKGGVTTKLLTVRLLVLNIPLLFILPNWFGILGILIAFPIADGCAALLAATFMKNELKELSIKKHLNPQKMTS